MGHKKQSEKAKKHLQATDAARAVDDQVKDSSRAPAGKLKRKKYEAELEVLQGELVSLQEWVRTTGAKICIVFEGRDTAGKGGTIKRIIEQA